MKRLLETERLFLCEMTMDMAEAVHGNSLDPDTRRFVADEVFETVEEAEETIAYLMSKYGSLSGPQVYAVLTKDSGENIGYVQLVPIDNGRWEIGYHIAEGCRNKGYASEAVKAFLPVMMERLGMDEVYGIRLLENTASGRVLEKCGFDRIFSGMGEYHGEKQEIERSVYKRKRPL